MPTARLAIMADDTNYGSLGALAPNWSDGERNIDTDEIYEHFFEWVADVKGVEPWPHQEEAIMDLLAGDHVILNTPTGSGKSLVALGMHFAALCTGRRSYYTAPIKALVSEKFFDLVEVFGRENVGMITGDTHINADAPIICCTAEILANQALREGRHADVGCVAMDEFHYYGDSERGWAWQVPLLTLPNTQFLLMSATLGNVDAIADKLEDMTDTDVDIIADAPRPVPLTYEYTLDPLEKTVELAFGRDETPIYVVHFSQDAALETANALASTGVSSKEQRAAIAEAIKGTKFTTAFGKILQRLLRTGVGIHHAGMLPRYRRLVEQLAQQGLLPVICGTDTLGVGINVPIHSVVLTALTKFDGTKMRKLRAREFHQIAGRAGRMGFDTEGLVIAEGPEFEIENAKALAKAGNDPKKLKKVKRKKAPEGFVTWNENTFDKLIDADPETLVPHMKVTHSMVLNEVAQGGDARYRINRLIDDSAQTPEQKERLHDRADEIFQTLFDTNVIETEDRDDGGKDYFMTVDIPDDFALDQPLSPFLLAALELLDPESESYALDVISMVEATLEDPKQVLRAQERQARDAAMIRMKEDGLDYDERMDRLQEITYPKPLEDMLQTAFDEYRHDVPWANDYWLSPKSVIRDMVETASDFTGYIARYNIARSEGTLLRYLSDAYRALARTVPLEKRNEQLRDIISWLRVVVRSIDSSLVDEWENAGASTDASEAAANLAAPGTKQAVVEDRRGLTVLVRNAMCSLWISTSPMSSARWTKTGAMACTNGRMRSTTSTMSTNTSTRMRKPVAANCSFWMIPRRTANTAGKCVRSSTIPMATMIGPLPEPSIWTPHSRAAKSCSSTTAFPTDAAFHRHRLPRAARSYSCSSTCCEGVQTRPPLNTNDCRQAPSTKVPARCSYARTRPAMLPCSHPNGHALQGHSGRTSNIWSDLPAC